MPTNNPHSYVQFEFIKALIQEGKTYKQYLAPEKTSQITSAGNHMAAAKRGKLHHRLQAQENICRLPSTVN